MTPAEGGDRPANPQPLGGEYEPVAWRARTKTGEWVMLDYAASAPMWVEVQPLYPAKAITDLEERLSVMRGALKSIRDEAERENGRWVHLKRVIALAAAQALSTTPGKSDAAPSDRQKGEG